MIKLIENFYSIQGEPQSIGKAAYFIRFPGCTLSCAFCDTKYASRPRTIVQHEILSLIMDIKKYPTNLIVFTGGEPLIHKNEIKEICNHLSDYTFEIETNGTVFPFKYQELGMTNKIKYNVSPKLKSSGNPYEKRYMPEVLKEFLKFGVDSIFKFVVSDMEDWQEMLYIVNTLHIARSKVYIMPEGVTYKKWREKALYWMPFILEQGFGLAPRIHIQLFGKKKGK